HCKVIDHEDDLPEVALLVAWAWARLAIESRRILGVLAHVEGDHMDLDSLATLAKIKGAQSARSSRFARGTSFKSRGTRGTRCTRWCGTPSCGGPRSIRIACSSTTCRCSRSTPIA